MQENEARLEITIMGPKLLFLENDFARDWWSRYGTVVKWRITIKLWRPDIR